MITTVYFNHNGGVNNLQVSTVYHNGKFYKSFRSLKMKAKQRAEQLERRLKKSSDLVKITTEELENSRCKAYNYLIP